MRIDPRKMVVVALAVALLACGTEPSTDLLATSVAATLTSAAPPSATPAAAATVALEPSPPPMSGGAVSGTICYPSEGIPPMTAYFLNVATRAVFTLPIAQNQSSYSIELSPGTYTAYAWLPRFTLGGSYSQAVLCGLAVSCTDHQPVPFEVSAGAILAGIDICDWYGQDGDVPLPPGVSGPASPAATQVAAATASGPGSISGHLGYPSEGSPKLVIVAFNVNTGFWWWIGTGQNQTTYVHADLPAGVYHVVAYHSPAGLQAGYATPSHVLLDVVVKAGETTGGIDLVDWIPEGAYPAKPGSIEYP